MKQLSDGKNISCELPYRHFDDNVGIDLFNNNSKRISVSGVQIKYSLVADDGILRLTKEGEQGEFILKPVPNNLRNKEFCPANEHLTMQIAAQVYGIPTAPDVVAMAHLYQSMDEIVNNSLLVRFNKDA